MVDRLSDDELAAAWHASCRALQQDPDPDRQSGWVLARQVYLDEFQRRSPEVFARWLAETAGMTERSRQHFPNRSPDHRPATPVPPRGTTPLNPPRAWRAADSIDTP
jgi:hypothetical protein